MSLLVSRSDKPWTERLVSSPSRYSAVLAATKAMISIKGGEGDSCHMKQDRRLGGRV